MNSLSLIECSLFCKGNQSAPLCGCALSSNIPMDERNTLSKLAFKNVLSGAKKGIDVSIERS